MTSIQVTPEFIVKNAKVMSDLLKTLKDREGSCGRLFGDYEERYSFAPATTRKSYYCCFPGGLCFHSLSVLKWMKRLNNIGYNLEDGTFVKLAFIHGFGKIGSVEHPYYIEKDSSWHREQGILYETNSDLQYMSVPHRSLWWAHEYGIDLSTDEYLAILLQDGVNEETSAYKYKLPAIALLLQTAIQFACHEEKKIDFISCV